MGKWECAHLNLQIFAPVARTVISREQILTDAHFFKRYLVGFIVKFSKSKLSFRQHPKIDQNIFTARMQPASRISFCIPIFVTQLKDDSRDTRGGRQIQVSSSFFASDFFGKRLFTRSCLTFHLVSVATRSR